MRPDRAGPSRLQRVFKRVTGLTPRRYGQAQRLARLKSLLKEGETVTNALYEAGYGSSSRLYEQAATQLGVTPATYRRRGRGAAIGYGLFPCPLGRMLVAATHRGLCAVFFGDNDEGLVECLGREYPQARLRRDQDGSAPWARAVLNRLEGRPPKTPLPLDVAATLFRMRVWEQLQAIPPGETRTYSDLAAALGRPGAARAVARACAANPVAVVIPCHRVVRKDGDDGGYRWGRWRKQALLERERSPGGGLPQD